MTDLQINLVDRVAERLEIDAEELLRASLETYLNAQLRRIEAEITALQIQYKVTSAKEIDQLYSEGTLPEEGTWEDYFRLDHLEYRRRKIQEALTSLHESR